MAPTTAAEQRPTRLLISIVTHDAAGDIEACLASVRAAAAGARVVVVDSGSTDETVSIVRTRFPEVELIVAAGNIGFAAAHNLALRLALDDDLDWAYLLNPDTTVAPGFLERALDATTASPAVAAVQSLLLLAPDGRRIDSAGNEIQFLGFGYCRLHGRPRDEAPRAVTAIPFASGAAALLRCAALREVGLLDEDLFLYCEDLDLGWRLRGAGYSALLAPDSIVVHRHEFSRHAEKYFLLERNRWRVLLANWSARALAVLALPLLLNEVAMLAIAWRGGWLRAKLRAASDLFSPATWARIRSKRRERRRTRRVADRELARLFTSRMEFDGVEPPLLARFANPVLDPLWRVLRHLL